MRRNAGPCSRIATLACVHDDHYFLGKSLGILPGPFDRIVFVSRKPWHGQAGDWERSARIAESCGAEIVFGDWSDEQSHRMAAIDSLRARGYSHALIIDGDEVYEPDLLCALSKVAEADLADRVRCHMDTYWHDTSHVVRPREALAPIALIKLEAVEHVHIRDFRGGRELVLGPEHGVIHHLSYAGPDERIQRKIETWSHRNELVPDWWRRSWLGWREDPTLRNLHPTHPQAYGWIERIPCPQLLRDSGSGEPEPARPPDRWPRISVVVPVYGGEEVLRLCLASLEKCADLLHEVIVVDDASPGGVPEVAKEFERSFPTEKLNTVKFGELAVVEVATPVIAKAAPKRTAGRKQHAVHPEADSVTGDPMSVKFIYPGEPGCTDSFGRKRLRILENEANLGFAGTSNRGVQESTGEAVLFLNSDTIVPRAGLIALFDVLTSSGTIGAAGPMTNNAGYYQRLDPTYTAIERMDLFAEDLASCGRQDRDVDMLVGFCLAVRRSVLDEVGLFDERFGKGLFEDTDLCYRIARAGYRLRLASKAYVHHWGSQSMGQVVNMSALLTTNKEVYQAKWAGDLEAGYASHLPGLGLNDGAVRFDPNRHPEKLDREMAASAAVADISLCMIVRNEERVLADCLRSAKPYFTQIVVVDTGSTDRTVEIAREFGAEVHEMDWPDSFSAARNESLRHARGKWVFWIDADDTMPRRTGEAIIGAALNAPPELIGFIVPVQFIEDGPGAGTRVDHVKLFRNRPGLAFEGRIHEQILGALRPHGQIARIDAVVLHSGYDTSETGQKKKRERDRKLLDLDLSERPDHPFVLFNFGMTDHFCDDHARAEDWLRKSIANSQPGESHLRKAYALLGTSVNRLGRPDEALSIYEEGDHLVGGDPELQFLRAKSLSEFGRHGEARLGYESMSTSIDGFFSSIDVGILSFKRFHNLAGECLLCGDYVAAREHWLAAIETNPQFGHSAVALFDAAMERRDIGTAEMALTALYRAAGPTVEWAERGEKLHGTLGGDQAVEAFLSDACAKHPQAPGPALPLARRLCRSRREEQALPMLRGLTDVGIAEAAFYLGVYEIRQARYEEALHWMKRSRDLEHSNPEAQDQIEKLEAAIGPPGPAPADKVGLLLGPHVGKLGPASKRFSVVVVTYNSAKTLETCLKSLLPTLSAEDEVIVVENASQDSTYELAKALTKGTKTSCQILKQKKNLGYSKAANLGVLASKSETIVLLNPDTEVYPGWIERMKACLDRGYVAVGPLSDRVAGDQFVSFYLPKGPRPPLEQLPALVSQWKGRYAETRLICGMCLMTSRATLDEAGLLCEETSLGADDLEFSWRLRSLGRRLAVAADVFVRHDAGTSFESLMEEDRKSRIASSDFALVQKLRLFYGEQIPSSEWLFGCDVFSEALERERGGG